MPCLGGSSWSSSSVQTRFLPFGQPLRTAGSTVEASPTALSWPASATVARVVSPLPTFYATRRATHFMQLYIYEFCRESPNNYN
jgi:hypothetical protein